MPKLKGPRGYTQAALVLVYLAHGYPNTRSVSKREITEFIRQYYPDVPDVQEGRHLAAQKGWFIVAGGRDNKDVVLKRDEYKLMSLKKPYPGFTHRKIEMEEEDWEKIKKRYNYRCATRGSKEGRPHLHWPNTKTKLQKAHKDPNKDLGPGNIIPQCQKCNRADRNNWVYDNKGRVIKLANPQVIKRSDRKVRWEVYRILYEEFNGVNSISKEASDE
ncbi:MAG: hypothetical protein ACP5QG_04725 [candidate division WOR-3 bacterium]